MSKFNEYLEAVTERGGIKAEWINVDDVKKLQSVKDIERHGFKLSSTDRMLKNGTLLFINPSVKDAQFHVTSNGYVRRIDPRTSTERGSMIGNLMYPINRNDENYGKEVTNQEMLEHNLKILAKFLDKNAAKYVR